MIHPSHWSPDYKKNVQKLLDEGFHHPAVKELPEHLQRICGGATYLVNDAGAIKSVSQATGQVNDVSRQPPQKKPQGPGFKL